MNTLTNNYSLPSYGKVWAIGHRAIAPLFQGPVVVQEKVDGSQISFGRINGELFVRSKGKPLVLDAPEKMFAKAVEVIRALPLRDNWIYRAEYLSAPKHNTLTYGRVPNNLLALFDVHPDEWGHGFLPPDALRSEADRLGVEPIPVLWQGEVGDMDQLKTFLDTESALGGVKIEGVVVKNYATFNTVDGKFCCGKYVSEAFKEKHRTEWKKTSPGKKEVVQQLIEELRHERRWEKAIQHLREMGELDESPKDIGALLKEVQRDLREEEEEHIKQTLFRYFWPQIQRGVVAGFPEWYKGRVLSHAFETPTTEMEK